MYGQQEVHGESVYIIDHDKLFHEVEEWNKKVMADGVSDSNKSYVVTLHCSNCGWNDDYKIKYGVLKTSMSCSRCGISGMTIYEFYGE